MWLSKCVRIEVSLRFHQSLLISQVWEVRLDDVVSAGGRNRAIGILIDVLHRCVFGTPVRRIVLHYTDGIDPQILYSKTACYGNVIVIDLGHL
jgi:hypothetical protein